MLLKYQNSEFEVEKVFEKGWEGIIYFDKKSGEYYLYDLEWCGGGYIGRVKKITEIEFINFKKTD